MRYTHWYFGAVDAPRLWDIAKWARQAARWVRGRRMGRPQCALGSKVGTYLLWGVCRQDFVVKG